MVTPLITRVEVLPGLYQVRIGETWVHRVMVLSLPVFYMVDQAPTVDPEPSIIIQVNTGRMMTVYVDAADGFTLSADPYMGTPRQAHPEWEFLIMYENRLCVWAGLGDWPKQANWETAIKGGTLCL